MSTLIKPLTLASLLVLAGPVFAQETAPAEGDAAAPAEAPAETTEAPAETPDATDGPAGLSMGVEEADPNAPGTTYVRETHGDWELRCIKVPEGQKEPCQLYQLLKDEKGNAISEINLFNLPAAQKAAAGANIITPLETLLTQQLSLSVDGSAAKRYPFTWCSQVGCVARIGFSDSDIATFKRGNKATLTIVPVAAPDQKVNLNLSLTGFTAGYDAVVAANGE